MFKLLLVTDNPEVRAAYEAIPDWTRLGFKPPREAGSVEEAVDSLNRHHADALIINLPEAEEQRMLTAMAAPRWQLRPILRASAEQDQIQKDMMELELLLSRTHADYSNDIYSEETMMQLARHEYFRRLLMGRESPERLRRYLWMLRSRMDPDKPCVTMELTLPNDDGYLALHWHYGADRLEQAMRNIFGAELSGMRLLVSVLDDDRICLLACPMRDRGAPSGDEMRDLVVEHARWAVEHVREYLNMDMEITSVRVESSLMALTNRGGAKQ